MLSPPDFCSGEGYACFLRRHVSFSQQQGSIQKELERAASHHVQVIASSIDTGNTLKKCTKSQGDMSANGKTTCSGVASVCIPDINANWPCTEESLPLPKPISMEGTQKLIPRKVTPPSKQQKLSAYEVQRAKNIEQNNQVLSSLGLIDCKASASSKKKKRKTSAGIAKEKKPATRVSSRIVERRTYGEWNTDDEDDIGLPPLRSTYAQ